MNTNEHIWVFSEYRQHEIGAIVDLGQEVLLDVVQQRWALLLQWPVVEQQKWYIIQLKAYTKTLLEYPSYSGSTP